MNQSTDRFAIIAGNGHFPFLVLEAARDQGMDPLVVAIKEETSPELAEKTQNIHWLSLGEVAKCLDLLVAEKVSKVVLAGQVKHAQLFSAIKPDGMMSRMLQGLSRKNTDVLIGAFVRMIEGRGMQVVDSTLFLKPLLPEAGTLTAARSRRGRSGRHRLWPRNRQEDCGPRPRPDHRGGGPRLRGRGSYGRHRRRHPACRHPE